MTRYVFPVRPVDRRLVLGGAAGLIGGAFSRPVKAAGRARPFEVSIPQAKIDDILRRVRDATLPRPLAPDDWTTGADTRWLAELRDYWLEGYDWGAAQADLNRFPQFKAEVEGIDLHFYHVSGEGPNPAPLILTHGWPGSVREFLDVIGPLTRPSRYGGDAADAFTVVIPSLPGFAFSQAPGRPIQAITTARLWHALMTDVLGYPRFFAQGGDIGYAVTVQLAHDFPRSVAGIHLNLAAVPPVPESGRSPETEAWMRDAAAFDAAQMDYLRLQMSKPALLAAALSGNPMGSAAWITEKFWAWSDHQGDLDAIISKDDLLTNVMLYLVTDALETSLWFYRGIRDEMGGAIHPGARIETPTAVAQFPKDYPIGRPPRALLEQAYNLVHFTDMPRGGHFAAFEQPGLFVDDVRAGLRAMRGRV